MSNVLVIGGGSIGLASALALARRGVQVTLLERAMPGAGASSTAAGVLSVQAEVHEDGPLGRLCAESLRRWPSWVSVLSRDTGIDIGYRACKALALSYELEELEKICQRAAWSSPYGFGVKTLSAEEAFALEPSLSPEIAGAALYEADARIDPPLLVRALSVAAQRAGVLIRTGALVRSVLVQDGRASGVMLEDGQKMAASAVVIAAGSWSTLVEGAPLPANLIKPARGQIVEVFSEQPLLQSIVFAPGCYLSPRDDGRVLVGSTMEFVGFRPGVTAGAVQALLAAAIRAVPALAGADIRRTSSCFRPCTPDELPILGATSLPRLFIASGHFRNGIVLTPLTAEIIAALVMGEPPPVDLSAFAVDRAFGA